MTGQNRLLMGVNTPIKDRFLLVLDGGKHPHQGPVSRTSFNQSFMEVKTRIKDWFQLVWNCSATSMRRKKGKHGPEEPLFIDKLFCSTWDFWPEHKLFVYLLFMIN
ncbi:uncharacterized protein PGTG_12781 [Puccinia graminis f. sp. tritici CRL 75-36-700-3]|uniref:Uncharacterized protein n=1 Tax=Puccinia graminis f. sp. tritici (strain CRL 75-36-700-3 / race SCCL) TaxID=418459 RepID=E3KSR4_PUCGT|nr:uncharacterized protein PGTG_12781 [Puccinia graminis f. sp. tritici CRL 75-36-700-3]EFP87197.1 hypothetical protein PGTG_12781 [Puccinia graminis f. sp. tritici CRL 75-36-700-3]